MTGLRSLVDRCEAEVGGSLVSGVVAGVICILIFCSSVIGQWRLFTGCKHRDSALPEEELHKPLQPEVSTDV